MKKLFIIFLIFVILQSTRAMAYKQLSWDSVIMLTGDFNKNVNTINGLINRIDTASTNNIDTFLIVFTISSLQNSNGLLDYTELDNLINYMMSKNLGFIPRIIVDSKNFTENIKIYNLSGYYLMENISDYNNKTQLTSAKNLLNNVITHLDGFANVIAYQIEWGHWGESWIYKNIWDTKSSNQSFINYLHSKSSSFNTFDESNYAKSWITGDVMYYSNSSFMPSGDPRKDPLNVTEFYWYQNWRNERTKNITWEFRSYAKQLTSKPIIGFSYVMIDALPYVYQAQNYLNFSFPDAVPYFDKSPNRNYIRDAYFSNLHLAELDFENYFNLSYAENAIKNAYQKKIIPVIFYPLWSTKLTNSNIPSLVSYINNYKNLYQTPISSKVLLVIGRCDIGLYNISTPSVDCLYDDVSSNWLSWDTNLQNGVMWILENNTITYDIIKPDEYNENIGNNYKAVIVFSPRDDIGSPLIQKLKSTSSPVIVMNPSFWIGTPTDSSPTSTTSAIFGMQNPITISGKTLKISTTRETSNIIFKNEFSYLGRMENYNQAIKVYSLYDSFDSLYAEAEIDTSKFPIAGKIDKFIFFGFNLWDTKHQPQIATFFLDLLKLATCTASKTSYDGICHTQCGASPECEGKQPNVNWCVGNIKKICSSTCQYTYTSCGAPRPGACPILNVWNGQEFKEIELLNIHAPKDQDTTYTSTFSMESKYGKYELILHEAAYKFWDGSHINSVKLLESSGKECHLISAVHSKQGDVLSLIAYSDDKRVRTFPEEEIKLVYDGCSGTDFTFTIEGYNMKCGPYGCCPGGVCFAFGYPLILIAPIISFVFVLLMVALYLLILSLLEKYKII